MKQLKNLCLYTHKQLPLPIHLFFGLTMQQNDTITAIATPVGSGGIGIIRLSGPEACHIVAKFFKSKNFTPDSTTLTSPLFRHHH